MKNVFLFVGVLLSMAFSTGCANEKVLQEYSGEQGPGYGKKIVLVSGDEEYRSEESLPQLGKMLAKYHGFDCTVLFAQDPELPGVVNPNYLENIPGLEALRDADLMIIATRFRNLPDEQMLEIENYLKSGRPVIGLRTATHGFKIPEDSKWAHWSFNYKGDKTKWHGGFGKFILGTTWVSHHGWHKKESTRGIVVAGNPLGNGIGEGDIWSASDVYGTTYPLPGDSEVAVFGQVLSGMNHDDEPIGKAPYEYAPKYGKNDPDFDKNSPMMPIAWTKSYQIEGGEKGKVFTATLGASLDLKENGIRTLLGNAAYWCVGLPIPEEGAKMEIVGEFKPKMFIFNKADGYYQNLNIKVSDFD